MALLRVRTPARPDDTSKDIPIGPATGRTHNYLAEAKTVDDWRAWERPSRPIHNVRIERR